MLTTDPLYWKSFQPKIEINNLLNSVNYYTFDAFNDITTNKTVYCKVDLGVDHHGTFEIQIENSNLGLDTTNIKKGQRVIISIKKDSTLGYNRLVSGLVRKTGWSRGIGGQALYNITGSSTAIRFNERIAYFVREAAKLASDGITIDITDVNMKADTLLQSLLNLAGENYTASGIATSSDVENFIPSAAVEFGELQDGINLIEEQSDGEVFVDINDVVQFRHQLQPAGNVGTGFVLKDTVGAADDANTTCYYDGTPEYWESIFKSDGYSSGAFGILPAESQPSVREDIGFNGSTASNLGQTSTSEIAIKFRPPHSHLIPGDFYVVGTLMNQTNTTTWTTRFRICKDFGGLPLNSAGIVANIDFPATPFQLAGASGIDPKMHQLANEQTFYNTAGVKIDSFDLDTTLDYWIILSNDNIPNGTSSFNWARKTTAAAASYASTNTTLSTDANGGTGWTIFPIGFYQIYAFPRRRSIAFNCIDPKALEATGTGLTGSAGTIIESTLTNVPSVIKTKEAMHRYMANQLYYMARPQVSYPALRVSCPNLPILPNDPLMIVDSTLLFSTTGRQAVTATTGAMSYEFGSRGGTGNSMQSSLYLNISPVGFVTHY
jgi:hypothetical protein